MAKTKENENQIEKYLPLSESTYYILLTLIEPLHGYGVMQKAREISQGTAVIGPGTLYGTFTQLEKEGMIIKVSEEERRKYYQITAKGKKVLAEQIRHIEIMAHNAQAVKSMLEE